MKKLLAALLLLLISFPLAAAEHISSLSSGTASGAGWVYNSGATKWTGTSVQFQAVNFMDMTLLPHHVYKYSITVANRTVGSVVLQIGGNTHTTPTGSNIFAVDLNGAAPIADNFTTTDGLVSSSSGLANPDDSTDDTGAFRSRCGPAKLSVVDPLLFPGQPGKGHLHLFFGNTGINANSNYKSLRRGGGSSCALDRAPIYRSGFWTPAMLSGTGFVELPDFTDIYYKQISANNAACQALPDATHIGICVGLPNGLSYVYGYNMATHSGGPTGSESGDMSYSCDDPNTEAAKAGGPAGAYQTLKALYDAGCRSPAIIAVIIRGPSCWDGVHLDTPDHRSHVSGLNTSGDPAAWPLISYSVNGTPTTSREAPCPVAFPYRIPPPELHVLYHADAAWDAGSWHLASDEQMNPAVDAGTTLHQDYIEAWSPNAKNRWMTHCINSHSHCSAGALGDGTLIGDPVTGEPLRNFAFLDTSKGSKVSLTKFGYSRFLSASGTFTGEITTGDSSDNIAIIGENGFTGDVTAFSVTDVTKNTSQSSVTIHAH